MTYNRNTKSKNSSIETELSVDDIVVNGIKQTFMNKPSGSWMGTMTELQSILNKSMGESNLPGSPSALRVVLNRTVNRLRSRGISVKFARTTDSARTRYVKFVF